MSFQRILATLSWVLFSVPSFAADHQPIAANSVTLILGDDGRVYASGDAKPNRGDDGEELRNHFEPIAGLKNIVSIDVDGNASDGAVALDENGDVWMWGRDWCDVVRGLGTDARHIPAKHPGLSGIKSIALGASHLVALGRDGRVLTVGATYDANTIGVLGNGTCETPKFTDGKHGVIEIADIDDAVAVAASEEVTLILRSNGTVWGVGSKAMLGEAVSMVGLATGSIAGGDDDINQKLAVTKPRPIQGLSDVVAISAGLRFAIALGKNGQVWGWGLNDSGQLGAEVSDLVCMRPRRLPGLKRITSISARHDFLLASNGSGKVFAQGGNSYGALGDDGNELEGKLREVAGIESAARVIAGFYSGFAILKDGSMMGWGCNEPSVGGFQPGKPRANIPPTPIDVHLKPAPASEMLKAGGVSVNVSLRLDPFFFRSEKIQMSISGKQVAKWRVTEEKDEQEVIIEIPSGVHPYTLTGEAVGESGETNVISGSSVILVSSQSMREQFETMVTDRGLIAATEQFIKMIADASERLAIAPLQFEHSGPWGDEQLDALEQKLDRPLPASYRTAMKTIGPFELGTAGSPHPHVSLRVADPDWHLDAYVTGVLQDEFDELPAGPYREIVEGASYMTEVLSDAQVLRERKRWHQNLIVGSAQDDLYVLVGEKIPDPDNPYAILWTSLFDQEQGDDGEPMGYFQWADNSGVADEVDQNLISSVYDVLASHFASLGVAPMSPSKTGETIYADVSLPDGIEDVEPGQKLEYQLGTDGW